MATASAIPCFLKVLGRRIDAGRSLRDRCRRASVRMVRPDGSVTWRRLNAVLDERWRVRRERTQVSRRTVAGRLYREYDAVFVGDDTPHGGGIGPPRRRAVNHQSLAGRFKETLAWTAARSGKVYGVWAERGATRTCGGRGSVALEGSPPDVRAWTCPGCGARRSRDESAALNGLAQVLTRLGVPGSGRLGGQAAVRTRRAWRFDGPGIRERPQAISRPDIACGACQRPTRTPVLRFAWGGESGGRISPGPATVGFSRRLPVGTTVAGILPTASAGRLRALSVFQASKGGSPFTGWRKGGRCVQ